jgi:hypothetical protein
MQGTHRPPRMFGVDPQFPASTGASDNPDYYGSDSDVAIYKKAQESPSYYYAIFQPQQCGYDGSSNLYGAILTR